MALRWNEKIVLRVAVDVFEIPIRRTAKHVRDLTILVESGDPGLARMLRPRERLVIVVGKHLSGQTKLPKVIQALNSMRLALALAQSRRKQPGENRNDRNHHQQL